MSTSEVHLAHLIHHDLLAFRIAGLAELKCRGITRTAATTGDFGEHIALGMYGGALAPAGTESYDLIDPDGRRLQVKARVANRSAGQLRVTLNSDHGFDACLVLLFDPANLEPLMAREVSHRDIVVMKSRKPSLHVSDFRTGGIDVLDRASEA